MWGKTSYTRVEQGPAVIKAKQNTSKYRGGAVWGLLLTVMYDLMFLDSEEE